MTPAPHLLTDERALESVEAAVLAGLVVAGLVAIVLAIRFLITHALRPLHADTAGAGANP